MHDALAVEVDERVGDLDPELDRGRDRQAALAAQPLAQRLALDVLHDEVEAALLARAEHLDDRRVGEALADRLLALEAAVEDQVAGVLEVRHLERHRVAVLAIAGAEDGRHPAARDDVQQLVLIERLARRRLPHRGAS